MPVRSLRDWARELRQQVMVVYFAARDPRTPWIAKLLGLAVAAYALSPIDLIPDFIPVLGYLDDLILVPLGLALALRLIPRAVLECARTQAASAAERPTSRAVVAVVAGIWLAVAGAAALWLWLRMRA